MVTIERVESRADLAEAMSYICAEAKQLSRRGRVGTDSERYEILHDNLDALITSWLEATTEETA